MKRNKPKRRTESIVGITKGSVSKITFTYDNSDGTVQIHELDPDSVHLERSYAREAKGEKILTSIKTGNPRVPFDVMPALRANYDYLFAVDTNTRERDGRRVSVSIAYCTPNSIKKAGDVPFVPVGGYVSLNVAPAVKPEKLGWHLFISQILEKSGLDCLKIGVVVDSELGELPAINKRLQPYYMNFMLPEYATLIYASDASSDSLPSQMIRLCDKVAESIFSQLAHDPSAFDRLNLKDPGCEAYGWFSIRSA